VLKLLTLEALNDCFDFAQMSEAKYVAVKIAVGLSKAEVIINPNDNFAEKRAYYNHAYNENLRHKFAGDTDIRIIGFTYGNTFAQLEQSLEFAEVTGTSLN
jgi:hypothetical protein